MNQEMGDKLSAFVIMPFDEDFDGVYSGFIEPVLKEAGFTVDRADNIESQQNILRDIVEKIHQSALIVADLTGANPNVFYELGLAHALRKPVILLTQRVADVPFDMKSYRLLEYSTHFQFIGEAKQKLASYAKGFAEGTVKFGSPVTDFYLGEHLPTTAVEPAQSEITTEDAPGMLDHVVELNDGYNQLASIVEGLISDLYDLNSAVEGATDDLARINANPNASSAKAAQNVLRRLAERVAKFNSQLKLANNEYSNIAQNTDDSLEFVVAFQLEQSASTESSTEDQNEFFTSLRSLQSKTVEARDSQLDFATKMDSLPRVERRLNREVARATEEVLTMAANLDKTIASISRVLKK